MKRIWLAGIVIASVILIISTHPSHAITLDGIFDLTEWSGFYSAEDGVGPKGYVGPGYGGQDYDVEYIGLKFYTDGTLFFGLQTGFNLVDGSPHGYMPGDLALDVNNDGTYEYAIDFSIHGSDVTFNLYSVSSWNDVAFSQHDVSNPFEYKTGTLIDSFVGVYGSGVFSNNVDGGTSHVIEGTFDLGLLLSYTGGPITLHWTMECGNDYLNVTTSPVPEPSTALLLFAGLAGFVLVRRYIP